MREDDNKTKWAFDTKPRDGSLPGPVYVGNKDDWMHEENIAQRWTLPLTQGATKAEHGRHWFQRGRYKCCHDMDNCGVPVTVSQKGVNEWHFRRQWDYHSMNGKKPRSCINSQKYSGETRYHMMTKYYIQKFLSTDAARQMYDIVGEVKVEITVGDFRPDVHYRTSNNNIIVVEVVYSNSLTDIYKKTNREKHEYFQESMAVIDLNDEILNLNDREFDLWMKSGSIDDVIQREIAYNIRLQRFKERQGFFIEVDKQTRLTRLRDMESKCRLKFGYGVEKLGKILEDFSTAEELLEAYKLYDKQRIFEMEEEERRAERERLFEELSKFNQQCVNEFGSNLNPDYEEYDTRQKIYSFYEAKLSKEKERLRKRRVAREKKMRAEAEQKMAKDRNDYWERHRESTAKYLERMVEKHIHDYGDSFGAETQDFEHRWAVDDFFREKTKHMRTLKNIQENLEKEFDELVQKKNEYFGFESVLVFTSHHSMTDMIQNKSLVDEIYRHEKDKRNEFSQWHDELETEFKFSLKKEVKFASKFVGGIDILRREYEETTRKRKSELLLVRDYMSRVNPDYSNEIRQVKIEPYIHMKSIEGTGSLRAKIRQIVTKQNND